MTTRDVLAPSAPSQVSEKGAWPSTCFQGWKWSLTNTESNPTDSAWQGKSSSFPGANCSADALYPSLSTVIPSPVVSNGNAVMPTAKPYRPGSCGQPDQQEGWR